MTNPVIRALFFVAIGIGIGHLWYSPSTPPKVHPVPMITVMEMLADFVARESQGLTTDEREKLIAVTELILDEHFDTPKAIREVFRSCAPWLYGGYHNVIRGRPGTGGCSMSGMMRFIAQYGILPYDTQPKIYADGEVDRHFSAKSWKRIYEKYGEEAARFQIKVARLPRNVDDIVACLRAGYAVPYGTDKKLVLDRRTGMDGL